MASTDSKTLQMQCHCGYASFNYTLPSSAFPLKSSLCHCTDCRYSTGQMFATFAVMPVSEPPDFSHLTAYHSSENLTRYFCPKCGASVGNVEPHEWEFATGMLSETEGLLNRVQMFVESSGDGGASVWLPKEQYERKKKGRDSDEMSDEELASMVKGVLKSNSDKLYARCHCGSVDLYIPRLQLDEEERQKRGSNKYEGGGNRYEACLCTCDSCRSCSGFEINSWMYVRPEEILTPEGKQLDINNPIFGHYDSSPGVHRDFCKTCGAKVFFRKDSRDPEIWDISIGLFKGEGARLDDWFWWNGLDFEEDAKDQELTGRILEGLRKWKS